MLECQIYKSIFIMVLETLFKKASLLFKVQIVLNCREGGLAPSFRSISLSIALQTQLFLALCYGDIISAETFGSKHVLVKLRCTVLVIFLTSLSKAFPGYCWSISAMLLAGFLLFPHYMLLLLLALSPLQLSSLTLANL